MLGRIFLLVFITNTAKGQTVTLTPRPKATATVNNPLNLTCTTTSPMKFVAFKDSTLPGNSLAINIGYIGGCKTLGGVAGYTVHCDSDEGPFILTIQSVTEVHQSSTIECIVQYDNTGDIKASSKTTIQVVVPLRSVSLTPNGTITMRESEKQIFRCFARSFPIANLSWHLNGSRISSSIPPVNTTDTVTSSYTYKAQKEDNGKKLSCTAEYGTSLITEEALFAVLFRPVVTILPVYNPYRVLENATSLQLTCNVLNANPAVNSYTWFKDNSPIPGLANYTIPTVNRSHTGSYKCIATNSVNKSEPSTAIQLEVLYGADILPIMKKQPFDGARLTITCDGQSYPAITHNDVRWTKQNNNTFNLTGTQLIIGNVNRLDNGIYICTVVINLVPTVSQPINVTGTTTVEVDVLYRPNVSIDPNYTQYNVLENTTNLQLNCTVAESNPAVTSYRWFINGSLIDDSTDASYTIEKARRSHVGSYQCDAENRVGYSSMSSATQLNVLYGVELYLLNKRNKTEGDQIVITCSGQSYPMITERDVKWSKQNNNTFSREGLELIIDNVNRKDRGTYVCSAEVQLIPTVGQPVNVTGTTTVEVVILYRPDVTVSLDKSPSNVTENTTNLQFTCNVTDSFPDVISYRWYKNGVKISTTAKHIIPVVSRSHAGRYTCDATNVVGSSKLSTVVSLDVLYGVSLKLSGIDIIVNEAEGWEFRCIGDGNPIPKLVIANRYNSSRVGEQKGNETSISVNNANCVDTGVYVCSGNNTIGESVSQSASIKVACKPRTYNNWVKQNIFINGTDKRLNISTTFISFPLSNFTWSRKLPNGNFTELGSEFNASNIQTQLPYEQISLLKKDRLDTHEFGIYLLKAVNIHGSFLMAYDVIPKSAPDPPTNITASCDITSISVTWISRFNGGENQTFCIYFMNSKTNQTSLKNGIADKGMDKTIIDEKESLSPNTMYIIFLEAYNSLGRTNSTEIASCTTKTNEVEKQHVSTALVGGIAGSISGLLIIVVTIGVLYIWHQRQVNGGRNKLIKRHSKETDEDEDGLKTNPLYVTSGEVTNTEVGPVYGVVNKKRKTKENMPLDENNDQAAVYSQVQKPAIEEKKKGKDKKTKKTARNENYKDIELGTVYENSDKLSKLHSSDELYANAGEQGNVANLAKGYIPKKNKDGLIYADLDLVPGPNGRKFVIRGIENKTNYAMIDLSIKVDPLPSDEDDDDDKDSTKAKSAAKECNE